jgi:hypothetical protein
VYVLPNTEQCREDFEWVRSEIVAQGGDATVFAADSVGPPGADDELVAAFQRSRAADYSDLKAELERAVGKRLGHPARTRSQHRRVARALGRARERLTELERIDFFGTPARDTVLRALANAEHQIASERERAHPQRRSPRPQLDPLDFRSRRWVTRPRPGVDRMASAWLIRRFIDPQARFDFVQAPAPSDVSFDMYTGAFGHEGTLCTFETLVRRFGITNPVVMRIGHIVHDLDINDRRYAPPEAPAMARLVEGLRRLHADDHALLEQGMMMFEALAQSLDSSEATRVTRPGGQRPAHRAAARRKGTAPRR